MGIESGVVARLNAVSAVTSMVSNRIYADVLPKETDHPAIVYQLISDVPYSSLGSDTGISQARVQLTLIADTKSVTIALSDAVKTALKRYKGSVSDVTILDSMMDNMFDQSYDLDTGQTARIIDFLITYE